MVESRDSIPDCVKKKMHKIAQEKGGSFTKEEQKAALGKSFGYCRSEANYVKKYDMDENKLRKAINQLEAEMKEKGITGDEERETYYRMRFMGEMSTGTIKTNQDYLREKLTRLQKVLKNVDPKDRKIILEEIEKIKNEIKARTYYRNYSKGVKYEDYPVQGHTRGGRPVKAHQRGISRELYNKIKTHTKTTGNELGFIIDDKGKATEVKGKGKAINTWDVRPHMKGGNVSFIHSHPSDEPFSSSDIAEFILMSKFRKMGIVTKDGTVYEVEKPKDVEKYSFGDITKAKQRYHNAVAQGKKQDLEYHKKIDYILKYFSDKYKYNLKYTRSHVNDLTEDSLKSFVRPGRQRTFAGLGEEWGKGCEAEVYPNTWVTCVIRRVMANKYQVYLTGKGFGRDKTIWIPKNRVRVHDFVREDASIFGQAVTKAKESKQRSIFFRPYRPLETLNEVTKTAGKSSSANVAGMEYSEGMLKVTFNWEGKGEVEYGYDVGPDFYERMAKSASKGKFLWSELRGKTPGYVIDNPRKMTPGGVGGSIVPYTKITKRSIQGGEFKRLQKQYAKQLKGKVKVVAHMPFVRPKQKLISRESKGFGASPSLDFVIIEELSDMKDSKERWVTIKGTHVLIGEGQSIGEAIKRKFGKKKVKPLKKRSKKSYDKFQYKDVKKKIKHLDSTLKRLRKKMDAGDEKAKKDYYILLKYRNKLASENFMLKGEILFSKKDFVQDAIPIKGHSRGGVWIPAHERKGNKAEELKKKIKGKALERTPIPRGEAGLESSKIEKTFAKWKAERKGEKPEEKAKKREPSKISEEKRRKEIDKQARATKSTPAPEPREAAIQKLIEETGMERKQAEDRITKIMGLSPEQAEKKAEIKAHEIKFKAQNKVLGEKLVALNQINAKLNITPLKNIISLFVKAFTLMATQRDPEVYLKLFYGHYKKLKRDKNFVIKQKYELIAQIGKIHQELVVLSKKKKKEDFEYISAAVDQCAKRAIAKAGGKGNYNAEVANCIRLIGISRRQAGLAPRPQGSQREQRRGARRARAPERREARRERVEERQREVRVSQSIQRAEQILAREEETRRSAEREARNLQSQAATRMEQIYGRFERNLNANLLEEAGASIRLLEGLQGALTDEAVKTHWERRVASMRSSLELQQSIASQEQDERQHQAAMREAREAERQIRNNLNPEQALVYLNRARAHVNAMIDPDKQAYSQRSIDAVQNLIDAHNHELEEEAENERRSFEREQEDRQRAAAESEYEHIRQEREQRERIVMSPEVQRARERARELRRSGTPQERISRRPVNAESSVSGLNEPEGEVIHIEIPRETHEIRPGVFEAIPEGMEIRRQGFMRAYPFSSRHYGERYWVSPSYTPIGTPRRISTRMGRVTSVRPLTSMRERSAQASARRHARREGYKREIKQLMENEGISKGEARRRVIPPKVKWEVKSYGNYASGDRVNIKHFKPNKWRSGSSLSLRIKHPDGREAGYASMRYANVRDPNTGQPHKGVYLGTLSFQPWASGETQGQRRQFRNAPIKSLAAVLLKLVDKHGLWISGQATPIGVAHGSSATQRLFNFYESLGGRAYTESARERGSTGAGFYRPPVGRWARSTDFVMDIRIKYPEDIFQYLDGNFYYYDRETNMMYKMEFGAANIIKNKIKNKIKIGERT